MLCLVFSDKQGNPSHKLTSTGRHPTRARAWAVVSSTGTVQKAISLVIVSRNIGVPKQTDNVWRNSAAHRRVVQDCLVCHCFQEPSGASLKKEGREKKGCQVRYCFQEPFGASLKKNGRQTSEWRGCSVRPFSPPVKVARYAFPFSLPVMVVR